MVLKGAFYETKNSKTIFLRKNSLISIPWSTCHSYEFFIWLIFRNFGFKSVSKFGKMSQRSTGTENFWFMSLVPFRQGCFTSLVIYCLGKRLVTRAWKKRFTNTTTCSEFFGTFQCSDLYMIFLQMFFGK